MIYRNYRPNRYGRRNLMWPNFRMRNEFPGLNWDFVLGGTAGPVRSNYPAINVLEGDEGLIVTAEIPGARPEDIDIMVKDNELTISGIRNDAQLPEGARYNRRERGHGEFSRTLKLGHEVNSEVVEASFNNGILQIVLPFVPEEKPRKIEIKSG